MVIFRKNSDLEKVKISMGGAGVLTVNFSDLGQTIHFLDIVKDELVRGMPDLQNPTVVSPKIERFPD